MDENTRDVIIKCTLAVIVLVATCTAVIITKNADHFGWLALLIILFFMG